MKRLPAASTVLFLVGVTISSAQAGVPVSNRFPISAKVATLTAGQTYSFTFRLYDAAAGGNQLFSEAKSYKVPANKTILHLLGSVNLVQPLSAEDFLQQVWVQVSTGAKVFPRIRLGPAPLAIGSQNADLLDGLDSGDFALEAHTHGGTGSHLDADLLDGEQGIFYQDAGNLNAGTLNTDRYSAYADLAAEGHLGDTAGDVAVNNGVLQVMLYAHRAQTADSAATADALSPAAQSALDVRYGFAPPNQRLTWYANSTVDTAGGTGTSITIGADGLPIIAHVDAFNGGLKVLHCGNAACSSNNIATTVESLGAVGQHVSITIGADGLPVISYHDAINGDLKVLHCGNATCSSGNASTAVDNTGPLGSYSSITVGTDGLPLISYYDSINHDLKVLHCGNAACSSGNTDASVDGNGADVGRHTSIALGADGLPVISYYDQSNGDLKVLHCGDAACSSNNTVTTVDDDAALVGFYSSITIGADGVPVISYADKTNGLLKVLHCGDAACSSDNTATAVDINGANGYSSIAVGADGLPIISYWDGPGRDLKLLRCGNPACASGNTATAVDSTGEVGEYTSITIGADGLPIIAYYDSTNDDLKVARMFFRPLGRR